jgi:hypothetical protein
MNITVTIIGFGFLALFIIPLVLISKAGKNKKKKFFRLLTSYAEENSDTITEYDHWKNSSIGIDSAKKRVYFISKKANRLIKEDIKLSDFSKCKLSGINLSNLNQPDTKIELVFKAKNSDNNVKIEFFDTSVDTFIVEDDLKLPEKWLNLVNTELDNLTKKN